MSLGSGCRCPFLPVPTVIPVLEIYDLSVAARHPLTFCAANWRQARVNEVLIQSGAKGGHFILSFFFLNCIMWHISSLLSLTDGVIPPPFVLIGASGGQTAVVGFVNLGASDGDVVLFRGGRKRKEQRGGARRFLCQTSITSVLS